jgi:hypothetical protein
MGRQRLLPRGWPPSVTHESAGRYCNATRLPHTNHSSKKVIKDFIGRSYWIPGSYAPTLPKNRNSFLRLLKNKGCKEERRTKVGLYAIDKSTTLESNKSLFRDCSPVLCVMFLSRSSTLATRLPDLIPPAWPASEHTSAAQLHAHQPVPLLKPSAAGATVAPGRAIPLSWLRVFRSPDAAHLGHGIGQARQTRALQSENDVARGGSEDDNMGMIAARFTHVLQRGADSLCMHFLLIFQWVAQISKTCNRLIKKQGPQRGLLVHPDTNCVLLQTPRN